MYYWASNGIKTAVILPDRDPSNPRDPDFQDNITKMVCWHRKHNLGDKHEYKSPKYFAEDLAYKHLELKDLMKAIQAGKLEDLRLEDAGDHYLVQAQEHFGSYSSHWESTEWKFSKDLTLLDGQDPSQAKEDLLEYGSTNELIQLCDENNKVAVLPLFLYDHGGISMSTGSFIGRAQHAEWDSGQVGFIYMDKETAMNELSVPLNSVHITRLFSESEQEVVRLERDRKDPLEKTLRLGGFQIIYAENEISNLYEFGDAIGEPVLSPDGLDDWHYFKKGNTIYELDGRNHEDDSVNIRSVAFYSQDLEKVNEGNWKARAKEIMEADVQEFDNFITGEVYGYQLFEGLDEVESSWGHFPGSGKITDLMKEEVGAWFGKDPDFTPDWSAGENFDIDEFFEEQDFPELRGDIRKAVESQVHRTDSNKKFPWPYAASYDDIVNNKDGVLDDVIEELYEEHAMPSAERIHEAMCDHAGVSRELKPKITIADLDPNKEYTAEELNSIFQQKKPSLEDKIKAAFAQIEKNSTGSPSPSRNELSRD